MPQLQHFGRTRDTALESVFLEWKSEALKPEGTHNEIRRNKPHL